MAHVHDRGEGHGDVVDLRGGKTVSRKDRRQRVAATKLVRYRDPTRRVHGRGRGRFHRFHRGELPHLAVANHEKDLERTAARVKSLGEVQEERVAERSDLLAECEALAEEQERLEARLERTRDDRIDRERALAALGLRLSASAREVSRFENRVTELRMVHKARVESRDRLGETSRRAQAQAAETRRWIERREGEIEAAAARHPAATARAYHASHLAFYAKHHPGWVPLLRLWQRLTGRSRPPVS